jgi:hypothetical protein
MDLSKFKAALAAIVIQELPVLLQDIEAALPKGPEKEAAIFVGQLLSFFKPSTVVATPALPTTTPALDSNGNPIPAIDPGAP